MRNLNSDNESLKSKFSLILFAYNLVTGYSKKIEKIIRESAFDKNIKNPTLKFNPGLALTGKNTILHFRVRMFVKSAVKSQCSQ